MANLCYTGTCTTATSGAVWYSWATAGTATSVYTIDNAWQTWATVTIADEGPAVRAETADERAVREAAEAQALAAQRARIAKVKAEREAADQRAEALLLANLTPEQREDFTRHKHVIVLGQNSGARYRVRLGRIGNVDVIDRMGRVAHRLCAHPRGELPDADCTLAQVLMLQGDEAAFLAVANRHASMDRNTRVLPALQ